MTVKNNAVAVIMSVYVNDAMTNVVQAIESIINQTKSVDIFIFVDGDIDADLNDYLKSLEVHGTIDLTISSKNIGLAKGLNFLLERCLALDVYDFIARMDADDISHPTRIERQLKYFEDNPQVDILGTGCSEFGSTFSLNEKYLPEKHQDLVNFSITRCPFIHPTVMFRVDVFRTGIRYPVDTSYTEDMALWLMLISKGYIMGNVPEILLDYRLAEETVIRRKGMLKAYSEVKLRFIYMFKLKRFGIKNITLILARIIFHVLPENILKWLYKYGR